MDGWSSIAVVICIGVGIAVVFAGARSLMGRFRRDVDDPSHVYGFDPKAKLLGTIPGEDRLRHVPFERSLLDFNTSEEAEAECRYQRAHDKNLHAFAPIEAHEQNQPFVPDQTIEQCISHAMVEFHREESGFAAVTDPLSVQQLLAEARDLIHDLNEEFGWETSGLQIADRMFNTNVAAVIAAAHSSHRIDFRTMKMITVMRSIGRAANGGRNELSQVMATRALLGSGRLTNEELETLQSADNLFGEEFAEAAAYVDHLDRTEELVIARKHDDASQAIDVDAQALQRSITDPRTLK